MATTDLEKHVFKANARGGEYLLACTLVCGLVLVMFVPPLFSMFGTTATITLRGIVLFAMPFAFVIISVLILVYARHAYRYASDTQVEIDPVKRHFVYTHKGRTIEFNGSDVEEWYDNIGPKATAGKLSHLGAHDSVFVLRSGDVIYLHAWLWDCDYSWVHPGNSKEHNIKFYLEAHREQLDLPVCQMSQTYKYMFP